MGTEGTDRTGIYWISITRKVSELTGPRLKKTKLMWTYVVNMIGKISLPYAVAIAALCLAGALAAFLEDSTFCPKRRPVSGADATAVAVTVVPIVVTSTTDDYFVLYVSTMWTHGGGVAGLGEEG